MVERDPTYFAYYGKLIHQQNMLSDYVRTNLYHQVVNRFPDAFKGQRVMDLGAGSGVLSYFCAQAGASDVFAVEASDMADKIKLFIKKSRELGINLWLHSCNFQVIHRKIEEISSEELALKSVDTLISEPIGVLLVHERMLESFLHARDMYLKDGGAIFPSTGTIHVSPFTDSTLWNESMAKARWWNQDEFFGIDFTPFVETAKAESFRSSIVGPFMPQILLSNQSCSFDIDFRTAKISDLYEILIPLNWISEYTGVMHGLGGWFDCSFGLSVADEQYDHLILSTHPSQPTTHWQHIRFLFAEPLAVNVGDNIVGLMRLKVNEMRSYDIDAEVWIEDSVSTKRPHSARIGKWDLQEQVYYYPNYQQNTIDPSLLNPEQFGLYK